MGPNWLYYIKHFILSSWTYLKPIIYRKGRSFIIYYFDKLGIYYYLKSNNKALLLKKLYHIETWIFIYLNYDLFVPC